MEVASISALTALAFFCLRAFVGFAVGLTLGVLLLGMAGTEGTHAALGMLVPAVLGGCIAWYFGIPRPDRSVRS